MGGSAGVSQADPEGGTGDVQGGVGGAGVVGEGSEAEGRVPGMEAGGMDQVILGVVVGGGESEKEEDEESGECESESVVVLHFCQVLCRSENRRGVVVWQ